MDKLFNDSKRKNKNGMEEDLSSIPDWIKNPKFKPNYDFNNKTILITGGGGFIGSNLALYLQYHYPKARIIVFDKFRSGERFENGNLKTLGHFENLIGFTGEIIVGDIANSADLKQLNSYSIDFIFHQAAISDTTAQNQEEVMRVNLNAFRDLLKLAKRNGAVMVYASSGAVYGNLPGPHRIGMEAPLNVYGFSKLMMDRLAEKWRSMEQFPIIGLRYFNVYGPGEYWKGKTASMILQLGLQLLEGKAPRLFEGSKKIYRDFVFIEDVIQANLKGAVAGKLSGISGTFNVGTGKARTFYEVTKILMEKLGIEREIEWIPNPYRHQYQFFTEGDISNTRRDLGYSPAYSLEEGIGAYLPTIEQIFQEKVAK